MDVDQQRLALAAPSRLADAVSTVLHPVPVVAALLLLTGCRSVGLAGVGWAVVAWLVCIALPFGVVLLLVRRGRLSDAQVVRRAERGLPVGVGLACLVGGLALLARAGAPQRVVALVLAMVAGLAVVGAATLLTKASMHTAVVAAGAAVLAVELGGVGLGAGLVAAGLVGWARVRGGRHTTAQVLVGGVLGLLTSLIVYGAAVP